MRREFAVRRFAVAAAFALVSLVPQFAHAALFDDEAPPTLLLGTDGEAPWILLPSSAVLTVAFLVVESRADEPILPLKLFAQRILATSSALSTWTRAR